MINLETVTYNGEGGFVFIEDENGNFIYNNAITIPCGNLVTSAIDDGIVDELKDGKTQTQINQQLRKLITE